MLPYLLLLIGLAILTASGDLLVRGAVDIAHRFHVPPIIIGLTIISMGTSAPEFFVSLQAALNGSPGLAVGNAIGSNIANTLIVMGLPALIAPLVVTTPGTRRSAGFMFFISLVVAALAGDGILSFSDGLILLGLLLIYLAYSFLRVSQSRNDRLAAIRQMEKEQNPALEQELPPPTGSLGQALFFLGAGLAGLGLGANLTVDNALAIAAIWGVGESVIGTTIVALGTTLPEIAATLAAAFRGQHGVAIGNVIGSNIFNILGILGATALLVPLPVSPHMAGFDLWIMLGSSALFVGLVLVRLPVTRMLGAILTLIYFAYLFFSFS